MTLEFMAMSWLRFEKRCPVALFGRSPRHSNGLPDVMGITRDRYLYEIEIKRSVSDFKANAKKPFHMSRNIAGDTKRHPALFWFLTPAELTEKVLPLVPGWAGLLRGPLPNDVQGVFMVKKAPRNKLSQRLCTRECVQLAHCMANQIYSFARIVSGREEWDRHNAKFLTQDYEI